MVPRPLAVALVLFASCGGRTELPAPAEPRVVAPDAAPATAPDLGAPDLAGSNGALLLIQPNQVQLIGQMGIASAPQRMMVVNRGSQPSGPVSVVLGGADASSFVLQNNGCLAPLAPGSSCTLDLVMMATTASMKSATLTASSPAGGRDVARLTGLIQHPIDLAFVEAVHDFGSVKVGTASPARVLVLSNVHAGVTPRLTVTSSSTEFRIVTSTCQGAVLTGGGTCTISVVFQPTSVGSKSGIVTASALPVDSTQIVVRGTAF